MRKVARVVDSNHLFQKLSCLTSLFACDLGPHQREFLWPEGTIVAGGANLIVIDHTSQSRPDALLFRPD